MRAVRLLEAENKANEFLYDRLLIAASPQTYIQPVSDTQSLKVLRFPVSFILKASDETEF